MELQSSVFAALTDICNLSSCKILPRHVTSSPTTFYTDITIVNRRSTYIHQTLSLQSDVETGIPLNLLHDLAIFGSVYMEWVAASAGPMHFS